MEGQMVTAQDIFLFQQRGIDANGKVVGSMEATGIRPRFAEKFDEYGIELKSGLFATPNRQQQWN